MTNRHQPNRLFENDGFGFFADVASQVGLADTRESHGAVYLDFDLDGDQGILSSSSSLLPPPSFPGPQ